MYFTDEAEVIYERKATPEQIQRARALQLPDNFYLYEDAPGCTGCIGCEKDSQKEPVRWKFTCFFFYITVLPYIITYLFIFGFVYNCHLQKY